MALALFLYFVHSFAYTRYYWSGTCTLCPSEFYDYKIHCGNKAFYHCNGWNHQRPCGSLHTKCEAGCCYNEIEICDEYTHGCYHDTEAPYTQTGSLEACAEKCASESNDGMTYRADQDKCFCVNELDSLEFISQETCRSCAFKTVPAYLSRDQVQCSDDNGQILDLQMCKTYLPKDKDKFGIFKDELDVADKPYGCFIENGNRYWNDNTARPYPDKDQNQWLICRGSPPIDVASAISTGRCPKGSELTEYECQYQVKGHGYWYRAEKFDEESSHTCGCYTRGHYRLFNKYQGSCNQAVAGETMICKMADPEGLCKAIVQQFEEAQENDEIPETYHYMGQEIETKWNVISWDPEITVETTGEKQLAAPTLCTDQEACTVEYTETKSETKSWTSSQGATIGGEFGLEFEAGVPEVFSVTEKLAVGASYTYDVDKSSSATTEISASKTMGCANYASDRLRTRCYMYATESTFNATGEITPKFNLVMNSIDSENTLQEIDCNKRFKIKTNVRWEVKGARGWVAREIPVCEDTPNVCDNASQSNCYNQEYIQYNCPATCGRYGMGPAVCQSKAICGFTPITDTKECPSPNDLNKAEPFKNCQECYNGQPQLCQATHEFTEDDNIDNWQVQNCQDSDGYWYNIFMYDCEKAPDSEDGEEAPNSLHAQRFYDHGEADLKDKEVEKAFDVLDEEAGEIKKFNDRLVKVNRVLRAALDELAQ